MRPAATQSVLFVARCHTNTIIPESTQGTQAWDRFAYSNNSPLRFNDPSGHMVACDQDDWACQTHWDDPINPPDDDRYTFTQDEIDAINYDGRKDSFVVAAGWPSSIHRRGDNMKLPTILYWGLSIVKDKNGGIQLYSETLDMEFNPRLEALPGEEANPSDLGGAGISLTRGMIWKDNFTTEQYIGEATSYGGSLDIITADYYESFPGKDLKGFDIGVSAGTLLSGWRISTYAKPITGRIDLTFWTDEY